MSCALRKWTVLVILSLLCQYVIAQEKSHGKIELSQCWSFLDFAINDDADSLDTALSKEKLPSFLNQYNLDWMEMHLWMACLGNSGAISFRKAVLDRVSREDVLEWIIASPNANYDKKYIPEEVHKMVGDHIDTSFPDLPYMEFSWRDLAKQRLSVLNHRKRMTKYRQEKKMKK